MTKYKFLFPKLGTLKLLSVWQKGKRAKFPDDYRFLMESDRGQMFVWLEGHPTRSGLDVEWSEIIDKCKYVSPDHIKNRLYNYYLLSDVDTKKLFDEMVDRLVASDPMVSFSGYMHERLSNTRVKSPIEEV